MKPVLWTHEQLYCIFRYRGETYDSLALKARMSNTTCWNMLTGRRHGITLATYMAICDALQCGYFTYGVDSNGQREAGNNVAAGNDYCI